MVSTLPAQGWVSCVLMGVDVALVFFGLCQGVGSILPSRSIQRWADMREQQKSQGV